MYVGPRISCVAEVRWQGNLHELQVGMMVATLAIGDEMGHSFWIAKITNIIKDEHQSSYVHCGSLVSYLLPICIYWEVLFRDG